MMKIDENQYLNLLKELILSDQKALKLYEKWH